MVALKAQQAFDVKNWIKNKTSPDPTPTHLYWKFLPLCRSVSAHTQFM